MTPTEPDDAEPRSAPESADQAGLANESPDEFGPANESADGTELASESPDPTDERRSFLRQQLTHQRNVRVVGRIAVALLGVVIGVLLGGHTSGDIGPMGVRADLVFGSGEARVQIPPLGTLTVNAFDGPIALDITVLRVNQDQAEAVVNGTTSLDQLTTNVTADLRGMIVALAIKTILFALLGAAAMSILVWHKRVRDTVITTSIAIALVAGTLSVGLWTFDGKKLEEPEYSGLLARAPALIGDVEDLGARFADYRKSLVKLVTNVSKLYGVVSTLPADPGDADVIRVLHISDIHLNPTGLDLTANLVKQFNVDFVIDTGDINDWGTEPEQSFTSLISTVKVPYVFIRGNHDSVATAAGVAAQKNAIVLNDEVVTVDGVVIAGIGDPRFTPDKETRDDDASTATVEQAGTQLVSTINEYGKPVDIALVHDPVSATPLADVVPLVLAGHTHKRAVSELSDKTLLMIEGSTGGAGLRGLEKEAPTPLEATVLYLDKQTKQLLAFDEVTLGGLGLADVRIQRVLDPRAVRAAEKSAETITDSPSSPAPASGSGSATPPSAALPGAAYRYRQPRPQHRSRTPILA